MSANKIIITDCDHDHINEETAVFKAAGIPFELVQCKTDDDLIALCQDAVAVCNQYAPFTEKALTNLPNLKMIVRYGVGVDNVDLEAATRCGVQVCNVPDYGTCEVADQALALFMDLTRKITKSDAQVKAGGWDYVAMTPITRLSCMTVGIIGLGRIGCTFAKLAHALGCRVIGTDIDLAYFNTQGLNFVEVVTENQVLHQSDAISIHCGLNAGNAKFMNKAAFAKMKKGALLINVARGGLVNEDDLVEALQTGQLGGAGIDVTCKEPLPADSPLRTAPNILITPHIAWYSVQASSDLKRKCAEEAVRGALGQTPRCPVNKL